MIDLSRYAKTLCNKPVAVYGLGLSGLAAVRALIAAGVNVTAWDDDKDKCVQARRLGAAIDDMAYIAGHACLVLSPGIPLNFPEPHPVVKRARETKVEIIGDIELLHRAGLGKKTIGITGTNGKSTTTALLGHILEQCGVDVVVGGNIGKAVLDVDAADVFVLELSSYQLDLCTTFAPDIAVHLNLSMDHIDRHGDLGGYIAAKMRIFRGEGEAVIGTDDPPSKAMAQAVQKTAKREVYEIATTHRVDLGTFAENSILFDMTEGEARQVADLKDFPMLPGVHNHQNIAAAYTAARLMDLKADNIVASIRNYPGLPHRMFTVRTIGNVAYINDSKATNADAAGKALACYRDIHWIAGGRAKEGGLDGLESLIGNVAQAYLIGEAADDFTGWLDARHVRAEKCGTLQNAVAKAHFNAQASGKGVVLLSPACASFDQFKSFEQRGQVFTDLVKGL
jgi:UDP-N-acetylmuramoylalanine--D-glutamate ligase